MSVHKKVRNCFFVQAAVLKWRHCYYDESILFKTPEYVRDNFIAANLVMRGVMEV